MTLKKSSQKTLKPVQRSRVTRWRQGLFIPLQKIHLCTRVIHGKPKLALTECILTFCRTVILQLSTKITYRVHSCSLIFMFTADDVIRTYTVLNFPPLFGFKTLLSAAFDYPKGSWSCALQIKEFLFHTDKTASPLFTGTATIMPPSRHIRWAKSCRANEGGSLLQQQGLLAVHSVTTLALYSTWSFHVTKLSFCTNTLLCDQPLSPLLCSPVSCGHLHCSIHH